MTNPTCVFDLENDGHRGLILILEPEGAQFTLPPGEMVQVHVFGSDIPMSMKYSTDQDGSCYVSFWSDKGNYELMFRGSKISRQP